MKFIYDPVLRKLFGVAIFLLTALVVISMVASQMGTIAPPKASPDTAAKNAKKPSVSLRSQSEKTNFVKDDTIDMIISADSKGELVTAFDLVLDYDKEIIKYVEARPLLSSYDIILPKNDTRIAIIGSQKVTAPEPLEFKSTALVLVRFKALKEGSANLRFVYAPGSDVETNLFNTKNLDILKEVQTQPIRVGKNVTLAKGKEVKIDKDILLTLSTYYAPDTDCFDCFADASIAAQQGSVKKTLSFKSGGIGGRLPEPVEFGGYVFDLVDITNQSVTLSYAAN